MADRAMTSSRAFRRLSRGISRRLLLVLGLLTLFACETSVVSLVEVAEVEVSPPRITLLEGSRETLSVSLTADGGMELSDRTVTWTVDDSAVATVSSEGVVEGRAPGTTLIHASSEGVSGAAQVTVVSGPAIRVATEIVDLAASSGDSPITREIEVVNSGNGELGALGTSVSGIEGSSAGWLDAELLGTTAPTRLRLRVSVEDLDEGSYEALVVVESSAATNGAVEVRVRLTVVAAPEPDHSCDIRNHTFVEDLEIPRNTTCVLTNVHVRGKLTLRTGARLIASDLRVDEALEADGADELTLTDARIDGDLKYEKGSSVAISDSWFDGKLELKSNRGSIELRDNIIEDDVKLEKNSGGPFILLRNTIYGKLECKDNEPRPTGSGNVVEDERVEQCRGL